MPAGVQVTNQNGRQLMVGRLSYFRKSAALCAVCEDMKSAVAIRPWFVAAQAEYLNQIAIKKQLLGGR